MEPNLIDNNGKEKTLKSQLESYGYKVKYEGKDDFGIYFAILADKQGKRVVLKLSPKVDDWTKDPKPIIDLIESF